jgi:ubiquinone/menaquinone biosynthesis C-methylase UbiE
MSREQEIIFAKGEADKWFQRNKEAILKRATENNKAIEILKAYQVLPKKILDIGCSNGYFLNQLKEVFKSEVYGIDISKDAIEDGRVRFPEVELHCGSASNLSAFGDEQFDLVIVSGLFCVIDRSLLFRVVEEVDRVLKDKGVLIMSDFEPAFPSKVGYHHLPDNQVFTYKQDYTKIFLASNLYTLVAKYSLNFETRDLSVSDKYNDRYVYTLLKKDYSLYATLIK